MPENSPAGTSVGFATIHPDLSMGGPEFTIQDDNFVINSVTGEITVADNATLDADVEDSCNGLVIMGNFFGVGILDVNDEQPVFRSDRINITIPETTDSVPMINCNAVRSVLTNLLATDGDKIAKNSEISYSIPNSSIFNISNPTSSPPCIQNNIPLDRDAPNYEPYEFILVATDGGVPPLSSSVTVVMSLAGVNEFPPILPMENKFVVLENRTAGFEIHQFIATDDDIFDDPQSFTYEITSGDMTANCPFVLNSTTGVLSLGDAGPIDAEKNGDTCIYTITVTDMEGLTGTREQVTITVTDVNEPATLSVSGDSLRTLTVSENQEPDGNTLHFIIVQDNDVYYNNNSFEIISGGQYFNISERFITTTTIAYDIRLIATIDRENFTGENFTIRLIEEGVPRLSNQELTFLINVTDVNDNEPFLNIETIDIVEGGTGFDRIMLDTYVVDADEGMNGQVSEIMLVSAAGSDDITDLFIDFNGNSALLGPEGTLMVPPLDRETVGRVVTINVDIIDSGSPQLNRISTFTLIILDLNDNAPQFEALTYSFSISENEAPKMVGQVMATDPDYQENGTIIYQIDSNHFSIDQDGRISSLRSFDREAVSQYILVVNARDNATMPRYATAQAMVMITILDVDDNPPMFTDPNMETFSVDINSPVGAEVGTVVATDPDVGVNAEIIYELTDFKSMRIDNATGVITLQAIQDSPTSFNLTVTASSTTGTASASKQVNIVVFAPVLSQMDIVIIGAAGGTIVAMVILVIIAALCYCGCQRRKGKYNVKNNKTHLNNHPERINSIAKPILKSVPAAANGSIGSRDRVQVKFSDRVDETHYDRQGAVMDEKVLRKASITNFGGNDDSPQIPSRGSPVHNGVLPVLDYEHSPGALINGMTNDLTGLQQRYEMHHIAQQRSPPMHMRQDMTDNVEFSQGTSSTTDVNSYNSDGEEESNFSDGASNMNTSIPCFKDDHVSDMHRYGPPPSHAPLYLHHSPHMPSPNGLLGVIHPGNMSSLAADGSYRSSQGNGYTNGRHSQDHSLSDSSSQTTIPSPHARHEILNRMEPPAMRAKRSTTNGHGGYDPRPLVMPDAYPVVGLPDMRDVHHTHGDQLSFSDFGEASTYASTELDEALNCNYELEPGFYSLTATDYGDHDDT